MLGTVPVAVAEGLWEVREQGIECEISAVVLQLHIIIIKGGIKGIKVHLDLQ